MCRPSSSEPLDLFAGGTKEIASGSSSAAPTVLDPVSAVLPTRVCQISGLLALRLTCTREFPTPWTDLCEKMEHRKRFHSGSRYLSRKVVNILWFDYLLLFGSTAVLVLC